MKYELNFIIFKARIHFLSNFLLSSPQKNILVPTIFQNLIFVKIKDLLTNAESSTYVIGKEKVNLFKDLSSEK